MAEKKKEYKVELLEVKGSCDSDIFRTMAERGDLQSQKIKNMVGVNVTVNGYALTHITTEDKEFDMLYLDTKEYGLISTGSLIFIDSLKAYYNVCPTLKITEVRTKNGTTFKAQPVLGGVALNETEDDLPF